MFIEREDYNNTISVKLVMPTSCNAQCPFCYNKCRAMGANKEIFLNNFINSLNDLLDKIDKKNEVSLDITGGEPTFDIELLSEVLHQLKINNIKSRVCRVVMTTNGYKLYQLTRTCKDIDVIDYVNISVHDYRYLHRYYTLGQNGIKTFDEYNRMVKELEKNNIKCSAVSVIYCDINMPFQIWLKEFVNWAKKIGFIGIRFRYSCDDKLYCNKFDDYMIQTMNNEDYQVITYENTPDSNWCRLRRYDGFRIFFLHGVKDTTQYTKGIEYIIDNNGKCYCDYIKQLPIDEYQYEVGKIYDNEKYIKYYK